MERIICRRLDALKGEEGLSDRQFGFRKARSTIDAKEMIITIAKDAISSERWLEGDKEYCALITLDVKNGFNSAAWDATLAVLDSKDVPNYLLELIRDYFKNRALIYNADDDRKVVCGLDGGPKKFCAGPNTVEYYVRWCTGA